MQSKLIFYIVLMGSLLFAHQACSYPHDPVQKGKQLYLPAQIYRVPENNDYNNKESEFSHFRKVESDNIAIFWAKEYGERPQEHALAPSGLILRLFCRSASVFMATTLM
ncbi:DUF6055 domain-containing protein [Sphingobacterium sp. IITKGP-BTPF85]|uniref:DUF6055 domain-containing protein n=1 Tax=Sphingobacterium sp. IITKGP-BTPF85 TaxID=1338009 RepID=UPI0012E049BE|nr:DUF6055 domain-containing protein [Sphingobacterium sp. IITKGP-BTPF85]